MSNSYFQFRKFLILQDKCAMKVTTDACIQGAWTPVLPGVKRVLDIGAGTGLLALMLAQKYNNIVIDAIELDPEAASQAKENIARSPWPDKINILEGDARNYSFRHRYDLIITNPPFFNDSLLSGDSKKNAARHTRSLTYADLLLLFENCLDKHGYVSILLPEKENKIFTEKAIVNGWQLSQSLLIKHQVNALVKRVISIITKNKSHEPKQETLIIQRENKDYTAEFTELLAPYYLAF